MNSWVIQYPLFRVARSEFLEISFSNGYTEVFLHKMDFDTKADFKYN